MNKIVLAGGCFGCKAYFAMLKGTLKVKVAKWQ